MKPTKLLPAGGRKIAHLLGTSLLGVFVLTAIVAAHSKALPRQDDDDNIPGFHIITKSVDNAVVNVPYVSITFEARGGKLPYTWSATGLPDGLSFGTSDVIHGKTSHVGSFPIIVRVTDNTRPNPMSSTSNFTLMVSPGK